MTVDMRNPLPAYLISAEKITVPSGAVAKIRRTLAAYQTFDDAVQFFPFHEFVQAELPELERLGASVLSKLKTASRFVIIKDLPFVSFELPVCKFLVLALTMCLGRPRPTYEYSNRLVWEVRPVADLPPGHVPTVTEHAREAEPHTDSSFKKHPERYVALFAVRPARSGGLSTIVDGQTLLKELKKHAEGGACWSILSSERFLFRRPTTFTPSQREDVAVWIEVPVISERPLIRYRYDVIERGFECEAGADTRERRQAIKVFRDLLIKVPKETVGLQAGDLLMVDNHEILHGRTAFEDEKRLLLRVRIDAQ